MAIQVLPNINLISGEKWLQYKGNYYISNFGRWYSIKSKKILKQFPNSAGYYRVSILHNGIRHDTFTHIAVVSTHGDINGVIFQAESLRQQGLSIDHKNRNKQGNGVFNLEIVTHIENCRRRDIANKPWMKEIYEAMDRGELPF